MSKFIYHYPELSRPDFGLFRSYGPGLGNLLFPIARALKAKSEVGGVMVFPTLRQLKIGTYLRKERDKRTYGEIFRRRTLSEAKHWSTAKLLKKRLENDADERARVIRYVGLGNQFHDLSKDPSAMRNFLCDAAKLPILKNEFDIAMHIRLGDFSAPETETARQNTQLPFEWYLEALKEAKSALGKREVRGILFSDEAPEKIICKLGLDGFIPEPPGNALSSIFLMSQATILIGSRSTFSLWGQYLGENHAIWPKGFDLSRYKRPDSKKDSFV